MNECICACWPKVLDGWYGPLMEGGLWSPNILLRTRVLCKDNKSYATAKHLAGVYYHRPRKKNKSNKPWTAVECCSGMPRATLLKHTESPSLGEMGMVKQDKWTNLLWFYHHTFLFRAQTRPQKHTTTNRTTIYISTDTCCSFIWRVWFLWLLEERCLGSKTTKEEMRWSILSISANIMLPLWVTTI